VLAISIPFQRRNDEHIVLHSGPLGLVSWRHTIALDRSEAEVLSARTTYVANPWKPPFGTYHLWYPIGTNRAESMRTDANSRCSLAIRILGTRVWSGVQLDIRNQGVDRVIER